MYFLTEYNDNSSICLLKDISFISDNGKVYNDMFFAKEWCAKNSNIYFTSGAWYWASVKYLIPIKELPDWAPENLKPTDERRVSDYVITEKDVELTFSDGSKLKFNRSYK